MRKTVLFGGLICATLLSACSKHDPILPGVRTSIFDTDAIQTTNEKITDLPKAAYAMSTTDCPYTLDMNNTIWNGDRKIFSGFPTPNSVARDTAPVCYGNYVFAGLTTGELVKINKNNRQIVWIADIYRPSNMTGGASIVDIVAPIVIRGANVYAGGLGDAFCKINATTGTKKWCVAISTAEPFIVAGDVIFIVGGNNTLYAIRDNDGAAYWTAELKKQSTPKYDSGIITVGRERFDGLTGEKIK